MIETIKSNLQDYIKVYDNVFSESECKNLIDAFDEGEQEFIDEQKCPQFHQVTLDESKSKQIVMSLFDHINRYVDSNNIHDYMFPEKYAYELVRIKRYRPEYDDQFTDHVDVNDHHTSRRFLSFIIYLNDVDEGGETYFVNLKKKIRPKCGRLVVFPPLWMFPHRGNPVVSNTKYILSTYLHYV